MEKNMNFVHYPEIFRINDKAKSKRFIRFIDNTYHQNGEIIEVTAKTVDYFNVNAKDYEKVEK